MPSRLVVPSSFLQCIVFYTLFVCVQIKYDDDDESPIKQS